MLFFAFSACKKTSLRQISEANTINPSISYVNSKSGLFLAEFIGIDSKNVYTGILMPSGSSVKLTVPSYLTSGRYDVLLSPEGSIAKTSTKYIVGGVSGETSKYPVTIKNIYIPIDNTGTISIDLK
jgi:hypothetical protein